MEKKSNGGFSLVELIIVIAIMAALVAILAPQYIKYVEKSRATVCASNLEQAAEGYNIERIDQGSRTQSALMDSIVTGMGGVRAGANAYTGLCPSGGTVMATYAEDGSVSLYCSKHGNKAPDFTTALIRSIFSTENPISRETSSGMQTLMQYLNKGSVVNSEAGDTSRDNGKVISSFTKEVRDAIGLSIADDQSWQLRKSGSNYVIYVTTGGKLTSDSLGKKVEVKMYTFDASGNQVGDAVTKNVSVTKPSGYSYPALSP